MILYRDQAFWLCPNLLPADTLAPPPCRIADNDHHESGRRFEDVRRAEREGDRLKTCDPERALWIKYYPDDVYPASLELICGRAMVEEAQRLIADPRVYGAPNLLPLVVSFGQTRTGLLNFLASSGVQGGIDHRSPEMLALVARFPGMSLEINSAYCVKTLEEEIVGFAKTLLDAVQLALFLVLFSYETPSHRNWDSDASDDEEPLNL